MLEDERDDRNNQSTNLLDKIDKEKRDRVTGLADIQHKFEDDTEHLSNKLFDRISDSIKSEESARGSDVSKLNQDIDDLHETILSKIKASNADVDDKISTQEKKENDKFLQFARKTEEDNIALKKFIEDEKESIQALVEQETKARVDEIDKINGNVEKEFQNIIKMGKQIDDVNTAVAFEKKERQELKDAVDKKIDDGFKIFNDNLNAVEGNLKSDIIKEHDLIVAGGKELDDLKKYASEEQNTLLNMINQEAKNRNEEQANLNTRINQESEKGNKINQSLADINLAVDKGKDDIAKLDTTLSKKLDDEIGSIDDKISQQNKQLLDKLLEERTLREKDKGEFRDGLNQINTSIKDSLDNEVNGIKSLIDKEKDQRMVENNILRDTVNDQNDNIKTQIAHECTKIKEDLEGIKSELESVTNGNSQEIAAVKAALSDEIQTRSEENELLNGTFGNKYEDLERQTRNLEEIVDAENAVRKQEALDLKDRLEREKEQLQEYIEKDNASLRDKLDKENKIIKEKMEMENEKRRKENEELQNKLQIENENIQAKIEGEGKLLRDQLDQDKRNLQQQLEAENDARDALKKQLEEENQNLVDKVERENQQIREKIKSEAECLATKLEGETNILKENMEKEKQDAKKEQERLEEEMVKEKMTLAERLRAENNELQERMKREQEERNKKEAQLKDEMKKNREGNKNEILELFERMKRDLEDQRLKGEELAKLVVEENNKRLEESKRIQKSRLIDKQKLQDYIGKNKSSSFDNEITTPNHIEASKRRADPDSTSPNKTGASQNVKDNVTKEDDISAVGLQNRSELQKSNDACHNLSSLNSALTAYGEEDVNLSAGILQVYIIRILRLFTSIYYYRL